jgi:hypothetical protein
MFSSMLFQFGGEAFKKALFAELQGAIQRQGLRIELSDNTITIPEDYDPASLARLLIPLLHTAARFVSERVGEQAVHDEIDDLEKRLDAGVLRDLDKYQVRANALPE